MARFGLGLRWSFAAGALVALAALSFHPRPTLAADPEPIVPGPWKYSGTLGVNVAQSAFSDNWKGGDKGSIIWIGSANFTMQRQFSMKYNLSNTLKIAYGQTSR
ncbi:MAG TPA: hypothetical protein VFM17_03910, partial [Candidatus Eisenbacteria bacterium]|nr:hypothetical protein [Candidatus Eisenbacteria bacterium]